MEDGDVCRYLEWDSEFFGCRIGRVIANRLTAARLERVLEWSERRPVDCLYFLADAADPETVRLAEDHDFRLVDVRVTLERPLPDLSDETSDRRRPVRPAAAGDVPALRAIARAGHRDTRFYYDKRFAAARCDALYETWIEKSCNGYADMVLVADVDGHAVGYISCHLEEGHRGQIGLVGINANFQGRALGTGLVKGALLWFAGQGSKQVTVVTQGRNWQAQRLYQRCGFVTKAVELWYHRWTPHSTGISR